MQVTPEGQSSNFNIIGLYNNINEYLQNLCSELKSQKFGSAFWLLTNSLLYEIDLSENTFLEELYIGLLIDNL